MRRSGRCVEYAAAVLAFVTTKITGVTPGAEVLGLAMAARRCRSKAAAGRWRVFAWTTCGPSVPVERLFSAVLAFIDTSVNSDMPRVSTCVSRATSDALSRVDESRILELIYLRFTKTNS